MSSLFWVSFGLLWLVVLFQGAALIEVVRRLAANPQWPAPDSIGADPLPMGTAAPVFEAPVVNNGSVLGSESFRGRRTLLAFTSPGCGTCEATFGTTLAAAENLNAETVLICNGPRDQCRDFAHRIFPGGVAIWDRDGHIGTSFRVYSTPVSVVLDEQWRVMKYGAPGVAGSPSHSLDVIQVVSESSPMATGASDTAL
jgi:peroxiredoxin